VGKRAHKNDFWMARGTGGDLFLFCGTQKPILNNSGVWEHNTYMGKRVLLYSDCFDKITKENSPVKVEIKIKGGEKKL